MMLNEKNIQVDRFDDIRILRYEIPDFEKLPLRRKKLLFHLSQAALCGRDILFDQNFKYNLPIRNLLERVFTAYRGKKEGQEWDALTVYLKKVWFANGIHHHYSTDKFIPQFSRPYLENLLDGLGENTAENAFLLDILFDPALFPKRVCDDGSRDLVRCSANNFYDGVTQEEAERFYAARPGREMHGLNSTLVKKEGKITEDRWFLYGKYGSQIAAIIGHLKKAAEYAENDRQKKTIGLLVAFYETGDLKIFDEYSICWLQDTESDVDFINGFIEVYGDPLGFKGSWESLVNLRDEEATRLSRKIAENAQWFEDRSPVDPQFRKKEVVGVSSKIIHAVMLGGDCYPATPIGINLPNADWIRKEYGSKSVSIHNITAAYELASLGSGLMEEFFLSEETIERARRFGERAGNLHTELHECLGHGSGQLAEGIRGDELKNYGSALEETRADLFALYYIGDEKLTELGVADVPELMKTEYDSYLFNGLMGQLARIEPGKDVVQAHMRCRKTIAAWCMEKGAAEWVVRDGKHFIRIGDYGKLRNLFGELLREVQRIKSEGDYEAGRNLIESYGVKVDPRLHAEVLERYGKLDLAPYSGFVNPVLIPHFDESGELTNVMADYTESYTDQMLRYSQKQGL